MAEPEATPAELFELWLATDRNWLALATTVLLAVAVVALVVRSPRRPGSLRRSGKEELGREHFKDRHNLLKDFAHALEGSEILMCGLPLAASATERLKLVEAGPSVPKDEHVHVASGSSVRQAKHLHIPGSAHEAELRSAVVRALAAEGCHPPSIEPLIALLSFVPTSVVLRRADCSPTLAHHRFVLLHRGNAVLRVIAAGFVGRQHMLAIISPNLLKPSSCSCDPAEPFTCAVQYEVRTKQAGTIEEELQEGVRRWASTYG